MTEQNTQTQNASSNGASNGGARKEWPQRFGTMTSLELKSGKSGEFGIITVDCGGKFTQTAFIFKEDILAKAKDAASKAHKAGVQANIWMKGPTEPVDKGGFTKDEMKILYFKDNTEYPETAEGDAPEAEETAGAASEETAAPETAARKDLDDEIPF